MIGRLQGEFGDLDNKYLKQNISKYPKISVTNIKKLQENTAALYKIVYETLRVGTIRGSGYVRPEKLKSSHFLSGVRIPDTNIRVEMLGSQMPWRQLGANGGAHPGVNGGSRVQLLSGYVVRTPSDGVSGRPVRVYSLHGFQRTLLNLILLWSSKSYQNTKT